MIKSISKEDTLFLKGVGIFCIIIHNFFHWVKPIIGENEFNFKAEYFANFITNMSQDPFNSFQFISSYLMHYGVQLFIFCSGYGLTVVYGRQSTGYWKFIKKRLIKLYPVFTIALCTLLVYKYVIFKAEFTTETIKDIVLRYTLIANWVPGKIFVLSGPYWFYSMIVQLYFCFPLLMWLHKKRKYGLWILLVATCIFTLFANDYFSSMKLSLYYNFIGNLPVFVIGMLFALKGKALTNNPKLVVIFAFIVFVLGQFTSFFWHFTQLAFILFSIPLLMKLHKYLAKRAMTRSLIYTGGISMYIFAVNGFMRSPWVYWASTADSKSYVYAYSLIYFVSVFIAALLIKMLEKYIFKMLKLNSNK